MSNPLRIAGLGIATVLAIACGLSVNAQEVTGGATTTAKAMAKSPNVTQAALDNAAKDRTNWLHSNGSYEQTRYYNGPLQIDINSVAGWRPRSCSRPPCSSRWRRRRSSSTASCS